MPHASKSSKGTPSAPLLIIVFALLAGTAAVDVKLFRNAAASLRPSSFLAESGVAGFTQAKVNVFMTADSYPSVSFDALTPDEYTVPAASCYGQAKLDRYFGGSKASYESKLKDNASCVKNKTRAWLLGQQTGAIQSGITFIETNIESSQKTLAELKKSPPAFAFEAYPGGALVSQNYQTVPEPQILCVKNRSDASLITIEVPVGPLQAVTASAFAVTTPGQESELIRLSKEAKALLDSFNAKKIGTAGFANSIKSLFKSIKGRVLTTDQATARRSHKTLAGRGVAVSLGVAKVPGECGVPKAVRKAIALTPLLGVNMDDEWTQVKISFGELEATDCMPYDSILRDAIEGVTKYISNLEKLKSSQSATLASLNKQIKTLKDNNYYCK